jgi:hypothetical protein
MDKAASFLNASNFTKSLEEVETAMYLADPALKLIRTAGSPSKLALADLTNICDDWKLLRAKCVLGLGDVNEVTTIIK